MSILCDTEIEEAIEKGTIKIFPYDPNSLGCNSYDVHLGEMLATYEPNATDAVVLDARAENEVSYLEIPPEGLILHPGRLYLGVTEEYTETHQNVPFIEGKSSTGRLGISIHATAGRGDVGFKGHWTLEIFVQHPVRVYAGMPIGQLIYYQINHQKVRTPYNAKVSAKYNNDQPLPMPSQMHKNSF